jgi:hypothetical protein
MSDWKGTSYEELPESLSKLSDDFEEFMIWPITITPLTGRTKFGEPIYGYSLTVMGIIIQNVVQVIDKDNNLVNSKSSIFIDGNVSVNMDDQILFNGIIPDIKNIKSIPDENGIYVKIIYI